MASTDFGRSYFSRPPYKSPYFWVATIWLLVVLGMALLFGQHYYDRLSPSALSWMCVSVAFLVILWLRAWESHSILYEVNLKSRGSDLEDQTRFDTALTQAASLQITGLYITLFVLQSALISISKILPK